MVLGGVGSCCDVEQIMSTLPPPPKPAMIHGDNKQWALMSVGCVIVVYLLSAVVSLLGLLFTLIWKVWACYEFVPAGISSPLMITFFAIIVFDLLVLIIVSVIREQVNR